MLVSLRFILCLPLILSQQTQNITYTVKVKMFATSNQFYPMIIRKNLSSSKLIKKLKNSISASGKNQ